jgi:hypothetical protein
MIGDSFKYQESKLSYRNALIKKFGIENSQTIEKTLQNNQSLIESKNSLAKFEEKIQRKLDHKKKRPKTKKNDNDIRYTLYKIKTKKLSIPNRTSLPEIVSFKKEPELILYRKQKLNTYNKIPESATLSLYQFINRKSEENFPNTSCKNSFKKYGESFIVEKDKEKSSVSTNFKSISSLTVRDEMRNSQALKSEKSFLEFIKKSHDSNKDNLKFKSVEEDLKNATLKQVNSVNDSKNFNLQAQINEEFISILNIHENQKEKKELTQENSEKTKKSYKSKISKEKQEIKINLLFRKSKENDKILKIKSVKKNPSFDINTKLNEENNNKKKKENPNNVHNKEIPLKTKEEILYEKLKKIENQEYDLNESLDNDIKMFLLNGLEEIKETSRENSFVSEDMKANSLNLNNSNLSNKLDDSFFFNNITKITDKKNSLAQKFNTNSKNTYLFQKKTSCFKKKTNSKKDSTQKKGLKTKLKLSVTPVSTKKIGRFDQNKIKTSQDFGSKEISFTGLSKKSLK